MNIEPDIEFFSLNVKFEVGQLEHKLHFEVAESRENYVFKQLNLSFSAVGNCKDFIFTFSDVWFTLVESFKHVSLVDSIFDRLLSW